MKTIVVAFKGAATWKFYKGNLIVARAQKQNTLYVMHARMCQSEANVAADKASELSHKRLDHMSQRGLQMLAEKGLLSEVKNIHMDKCTIW